MRRLLALCLAAASLSCAGRTPAGPAAPPPTPSPLPAPPMAPTAPPAGVPEARPLATLAGTVVYHQRIALTPEAAVQIELRDVSRADTEAPLMAKQVIEKPGQVPIPFSLPYDPSLIEPGHLYAVSARITDRGQLQFVTDTRVPVLAAGAPTPIEIVVVPIR